ncbi:MAG: hypothetical protein EOO29_55595 [Comamonadaceae bacterium]|nr:MAG: hypothetical protein EOO29_55595 [Comamonadaceae bacterium]
MTPRRRFVSWSLLAFAALMAFGAGPAAAQGRSARDIPYATNFTITVATNSNGNGVFSPDAVPLNKRLVIEYVSVSVFAQSGDKPSLFLSDLVNGAGRNYWIPLTLVDAAGPGGMEVYRASQLVKLNHDGNGVNGPGAHCGRYYNTYAPVTCSLTISGYLVDK